jgi:putative endonuclease
MTDNKSELARKGEELAAAHLTSKGYSVLQRNLRIGQGEVDIVARQGEEIVFVEVKTRSSAYLTEPVQLVPVSKQRQLLRLADRFLKDKNLDSPARFDIVIVVHNSMYSKIEHIEDAFYPMGG